MPIDVNLLPPNVEKLSTSIEEHRARIVTQLEEAQRLAKQNIERTQQQMKAQYDLKASPHKFEIEQQDKKRAVKEITPSLAWTLLYR